MGNIHGGRAVAILTGNGLKDPDTAQTEFEPSTVPSEADSESVERALGL